MWLTSTRGLTRRGFFGEKHMRLPLLVCVAFCALIHSAAASTALTVMTMNAWGAGGNNGKTIDETVAVLKKINPDIIGMQETRRESIPCTDVCPASGPNRAADIAKALGYYFYVQKQDNAALWANAVFSRYPILGATKHDLGVIIDVKGRKVAVFNIHPTDFPYQPYQLLGIPYSGEPRLHTAAEAEDAARKARGPAIALLKQDMPAADGADLAFVFGDFNEPSYRDWTARAAAIHRHPMVVRYPTALAVEQMGFTDALRSVYPDEIAKPAFTWSSHSALNDPNDHPDRIDFIFVRGKTAKVDVAGVVGEQKGLADVVVTPWPSDHRAVFAHLSF